MGWNYLSIPKLKRCNRWSLGLDKQFHPTLYNGCNYLSMVGLKIKHVSKMGVQAPGSLHFHQGKLMTVCDEIPTCHQNFTLPIFHIYPGIVVYETSDWSKSIKIALLMIIERIAETLALNQTILLRYWRSVAVILDYIRWFILLQILI